MTLLILENKLKNKFQRGSYGNAYLVDGDTIFVGKKIINVLN